MFLIWNPGPASDRGMKEQKFLVAVGVPPSWSSAMQAVLDRIMQTYGMLVNLTVDEEQVARGIVSRFLESSKIDDENKLAVEGLRYLRAFSRSSNFCLPTGGTLQRDVTARAIDNERHYP